MRVSREKEQAFLAIIAGLGSLLFSASCGSSTKTNAGFPLPLEDIKGEDFEDTLWKKIRELLGISALAGDSQDELIASLGAVSQLVTDPNQSAAQAGKQTKKVVGNAEASVCEDIKTPLVDINPGSAAGLSGGFKIVNGDPLPKALALPNRVYLFQYKLKGDTNFRSALVAVPVSAPGDAHAAAPQIATQSEASGNFGYPILMYGHAAASGLAYEEIALSLGDLQSGHIVAAPTFPGEPLCATYDTVSGVKSTRCTGTNILVPAVGTALPYENDVTDYLGLYDCMKTFASETAGRAVVNLAQAASGSENISTKIIKVNQSAQTALASVSPVLAAAAGGPVTIASGLGRGASVAGLAIARAGAINSVYLAATPDATAQAALAAKGAFPALFSCSLLISPQATFTSGKNKIFLDYWAKEVSNILAPAEQSAIEAIPTFAGVHAKLSDLRTDSAASEDDKAEAMAAYVEDIDLLLNVPLMHAGLQNFGKQFTAKLLTSGNPVSAGKTVKKAQGASLLLHGLKDQVADVSNSVLLSNVGVAVSASFSPPDGSTPAAGGFIQGINWLALDVAPPAASVDANGSLSAGDVGHVASPNFANGTTGVVSGVVSNISGASYLNLSPGTVTGKWLLEQCYTAIDASAVP